MKKYIADRTSLIDASGIRKVFALAESLENPVNLSIGQPDFDVPEKLKTYAIDAIEKGFNKYSQTVGDSELREKIAAHIKQPTGWKNPQILVTSGVSGGLLLAFLAMLNPGDEVIIPDPYFVIYKHIVKLFGAKPVFIDSYPDFELPVQKIANAITSRTKLIIINSPCNPTGAVYAADRLKSLANIAAKHDLVALSDEIYEKFSYDSPCPTIAEFYPKTLLLRGFGKTFAMTGWRLGYAVVDESLSDLLDQMTKIQQYTFVCAPTPFQKAAIAALDYDTTEFVEAYRKKRDIVTLGLSEKFELVKPQGAFYAFIKAPSGSATDFVKKAIAKNLLIIPGSVFSEKDTHFRLSFAAPDDQIRRGIEILCSFA